MKLCRNPACPNPNNPLSNRYCQSCGVSLDQDYLFRNRYQVKQLLGQGAFGRTYQAEDLDCLNHPCVIKKFIGTQQKGLELFEREAKKLYELAHPQIPRLYAYFQQDNSLYLVQDFIHGEDLFKSCLKQGTFSETDILALLSDLLPVLDYIHSRGLLHRDIKPENIMRYQNSPLFKGGRGGSHVLIDFGGVKQITGTQQGTPGTQLYTPGYAAIEQVMGSPLPASDIYSLGATCIRLLTGIFPQHNAYGDLIDDLYDTLNVRWVWREKLAEQGKTISDRLASILEKMLETFASNRYSSAKEVLADINNVSTVPPTILSPTIIAVPPISPPPPAQSGLKTFSFEVVSVDKQGKIVNRETCQAQYFPVDLGNGVVLEMVAIPGGRFDMGSPETEEGHRNSESPVHRVSIEPFFMSKYPITQCQWEAVMKNNPSHFKGKHRPVECVSWNMANEFCEQLSKIESSGRTYRLPSEAQWEYACRAMPSPPTPLPQGEGRTYPPFYFGETITTDLANYNGNSTYANAPKGVYRKGTTNVGDFPPNRFGLYDMHGNVWEWCLDTWHNNYVGAPLDETPWIENDNDYQILRGGSWIVIPLYCRSAYRLSSIDRRGYYYDVFGFRVVCVAPRTL